MYKVINTAFKNKIIINKLFNTISGGQIAYNKLIEKQCKRCIPL